MRGLLSPFTPFATVLGVSKLDEDMLILFPMLARLNMDQGRCVHLLLVFLEDLWLNRLFLIDW